MKLSRTANTALLLASMLVEGYGKDLTSLPMVSQKHGVSVLFLKKIVRCLRQAGFVKSKEGSGGGYMLAKHPSGISVWDIIVAVDHIDKKNNDSGNIACPINKHCLPQSIQKSIDMKLKESLSGISLEEMA
jgi:Rrf2 family protein